MNTISSHAIPNAKINDELLGTALFGRTGETAHESNLGMVSTVNVQRAIAFVDGSGVVEQLEEWRIDYRVAMHGKHGRAGARARLGIRELLIILFVAVFDEKPLNITRLAEIIAERMTPEQLELVGLDTRAASATGLYKRLTRVLDGLLECIDPYPSLRGKRPSWEYHEQLRKEEGEDPNVEVMRARLDWLANSLLEASWRTLPPEIRALWAGNLAVDGTKVKVVKDGNYPNMRRASFDRDAGFWAREGDHKGQPIQIHTFAYEAHVGVTVPNHPRQEGLEPPVIALGIAFGRPGVGPGDEARRLTASIRGRGHPAGLWLGDGVYAPMSKAETLQGPLRAMGYGIVSNLSHDPNISSPQLGIQAHHAGAIMVEGRWYCPAMPPALINATIDYRDAMLLTKDKDEKKQLETEWRTRLGKRGAYEVKRKSASVEYGHGIPHRCPAGFTVDCPLPAKFREQKAQKKGLQPVRTTTPKPIGTKPLVPIQRKHLPDIPGAICENPSSTHFAAEAGLRYQQEFAYGSPEHISAYDMRTMVEGYFGFLKTGPEEADVPSRRRTPGYAAQYLLWTVLAVSGNLRKIRGFLEDHRDEVERMVVKAQRRGTINWPKDSRGANMATLRDHLPVPRSMDLVDDFMERRRLIFNDRMRTQDPARKRRRAGDEQEPPEVMAA